MVQADKNLISGTSRVVTPFIKVKLDNYIFGVYSKSDREKIEKYTYQKVIYPNYIQDLTITKINGQVNQYELTIIYPITHGQDPNFFEKIFSKVSKTRKISFSYGDVSMPYEYTYRDEEALITKIKTKFDTNGSKITYLVSAISTGKLSSVGNYSFEPTFEKPSEIIKEILYNKKYGLQDLFYGMKNKQLNEQERLILDDDKKVQIKAKENISITDYLVYLVSIMSRADVSSTSLEKSDLYTIVYVDDTSGKFGGPYFRINRCDKIVDTDDTYLIDIGFPSQNVVTNFEVEDDETFSLYYDYQGKLNPEQFVDRIGDDGKIERVYAPILSSNSVNHTTTEEDKSWWSKVTKFPIKASITLKGLIRPAVLMSKIKLNVYYYGKKHISSGIYTVTQEKDTISASGFLTTLSILRIDSVDEEDYN